MTARNHAAPLSWRPALLDILILGTLLTITLLLGTTIPHPPHVLRLTIDRPSVVFRLAGMYPVERFAAGAQVFRWTRAQSQLSFPVPGDPAILQITLLGHPDEPTYARLKLGALDELITIQPTLRRYSLLLSPLRGEQASMLIEAPVATIAGRDLGVAVSDAVLVSRGASMPILVLIALAIAMIGSYSLAVQARAPRWMAAGGVLVLAVLALLSVGAGIAWALRGALDAWLPGLVLLLIGCATLIIALRQSPYVAWLRQGWNTAAAAFDPLSSLGIGHAISSGIHAARGARHAVRGRRHRRFVQFGRGASGARLPGAAPALLRRRAALAGPAVLGTQATLNHGTTEDRGSPSRRSVCPYRSIWFRSIPSVVDRFGHDPRAQMLCPDGVVATQCIPTHHTSRITHHASRITHPASRITHHVLRR